MQTSMSYEEHQSDNPPSYASVITQISSIHDKFLQPREIKHVKRVESDTEITVKQLSVYLVS